MLALCPTSNQVCQSGRERGQAIEHCRCSRQTCTSMPSYFCPPFLSPGTDAKGQPDDILVGADGGETSLPSGPVRFGTDQTILESVVRIVKEQMGIHVEAIRAHVSTLKSAIEPEAKAEGSRAGAAPVGPVGDDGRGGGGERRFVFIAEVPANTPPPPRWRWAPRQEAAEFKIGLSGDGRTVLHSKQTVSPCPFSLLCSGSWN